VPFWGKKTTTGRHKTQISSAKEEKVLGSEAKTKKKNVCEKRATRRTWRFPWSAEKKKRAKGEKKTNKTTKTGRSPQQQIHRTPTITNTTDRRLNRQATTKKESDPKNRPEKD